MKILPTLHLQNGLAVPWLGAGQRPRNPCELVDFLLDRGCHRLALVDVDAAGGQATTAT